jgi:CubicO group peptidase (beta-lactamase class C family)
VSSSAPDNLRVELERLVRKEQAEKRLPSVAAAVVRDGEVVWETAVGLADVDAGREATPDTQYRVGSITKTFTAVCVMQLRDEGRLDLEDTIDRHLGETAYRPTVRRLLSHTSGIQREPPGDVWETLQFAPAERVLEILADAEQVLPPGARFHYSNLAFAVLGVLVERVSGVPYERFLRERILEPLGLERTALAPVEPAAVGYLVHPYADSVWDEAPVDTGGWIPAGQIWGTVHDLCRWAAFLVDPEPSVLKPETAEEMRVLQTIDEHERWTSGYGLGLALRRDGERILAGHGGSMPGFMASLLVSPKERVGAATLTNGSTLQVEELARALISATVDQFPADPEAWRTAEPLPDELEGLLGVWFLEGSEMVLRWRKGRLEATFPLAPDWWPPSVFAREDDDLYRTVSGREQGERLRLVRDESGRVVKMYWATYPITREPRPFGHRP